MGEGIKDVQFVMSNSDVRQCPAPDRPEYAFIGRSNVGKSSLINKLVKRNRLAKTSSTPGKTQLINHFVVNDSWYLVDLPGYGYAKVSKAMKAKFERMIADYVLGRENLINMFVLIDARHAPQNIDLEFMQWLGVSEIPFSIVFTKLDKLKNSEVQKKMMDYQNTLFRSWEELPKMFYTSAEKGTGVEELLDHIEWLNQQFAGQIGKVAK